MIVVAGWGGLVAVSYALLSPAFRLGHRHDRVNERDAVQLRMMPRTIHQPRPLEEPTRASYLVETGYLGLVHDRLCTYARTVLGLERSWLLLRDPDHGDDVVVAAARGTDPEHVGARLPADAGVMSLMLASPRPTVLPHLVDANEDEGPAHGVRALATAPVSWEGHVRGSLAVATRDPSRVFGIEDLELLGEVAWLSGAAMSGYEHRAEMAQTVSSQVDALAKALEIWDSHTHEHSETVVHLARVTGLRMGLDPAELLELELAALLHDVGKLRVPREILRKPADLTAGEERLLRNHPAWGAELVSGVPGLQAVALIVRHHHERVDGLGYPSGIAGVRIPVASRIMSACDAYGAMVERRPYREAHSPEAAIAELHDHAGTQFDPAVVDALEAEVGVRPLAVA